MSRLLGANGVTRILGGTRRAAGIMSAIEKNVLRVLLCFIALLLIASLIR
jgi:hypothetical protein